MIPEAAKDCSHEKWDYFLERCVDCGATAWQLLDPTAPGIGDDTFLLRVTNEVFARTDGAER